MFGNQSASRTRCTEDTSDRCVGVMTEKARPPQTVASAIDQARIVQNEIAGVGENFDQLAERATRIAESLGGSFPSADRGGPSEGKAPTGPMSGVEALNRAVEDLKGPVHSLSRPLYQISQALDAIERAIG